MKLITWTPDSLTFTDGDTERRLVITEDGTVRRVLPACRQTVAVLDKRYQPVTAEPLRSEADAVALIERVRT